ncbi:RNA polymerase sigma factor SigB [Pseudogracilibacillus auburnensis]|uniref:RNA polymerase sigma-37 (RpsB/SigB) subunit n=1 Tax=Pseudogracilibacillus auburnensis TaxID=1494959 RepID=A0A2V3WBF7_9BACI|nr:RNA polymerase sigma factor SigB [Pseudogracilibacillus auburnensis]MBO1003638.1 RNA polymerase sigma factor SigB [Pseudogracilibacillus auburnensis]PXW90351.1 RNA polymerase sigma-37 (RpsB/SigB) subunit [Pseudogracilibacillus auburnensis]
MTKSKQNNEEEGDVYSWIDHLQKHPNDQEIKEKFVLHYEGLVHSLARKYSHNRGNHEDLAQVGMIGLLIAVERFNKDFGKSFEAFAIPTIIGEIKRFIRDKTWSVHVPRRIKELGPKINRAVDDLTNELQKSPTVYEIAHYLGVSEEEVLETMEMSKSYKALSVDYKHEVDADGGAVSILDLVGAEEESYDKVDIHMVLESVFPVLPEREQQILKYIFFDNLSQQEVGELLGISQMHVSRLQRRSLRKLREMLESETENYAID